MNGPCPARAGAGHRWRIDNVEDATADELARGVIGGTCRDCGARREYPRYAPCDDEHAPRARRPSLGGRRRWR